MDHKKIFKCNECVYLTIFKFAFTYHQRQHELKTSFRYPCIKPLNMYECKECSFLCECRKVLYLHKKNHHTNIDSSTVNPSSANKCETCCFETHSTLIWACHKMRCQQLKKVRIRKRENKIRRQINQEVQKPPSQHTETIRVDIKDINMDIEIDKTCISSDAKNIVNNTESYYTCEFCPFMTLLKTSINVHKLHKHPSECRDTYFQCNKCKYRTFHSSAFNAHIRSVHTDTHAPPVFKCSECPYTGSTKYLVICHKRKCHYKENKLQGGKNNGKKLMSKNDLQQSDKVQVEFTCQFCFFKFTSEEHRKSHVDNKLCAPEGKEWLRCKHCAYMTNIEFSFKMHTKKCTKKVDSGK